MRRVTDLATRPVVLLFVSAVLLGTPVSGGATADASAAPVIDLANPTASVHDPVAGLAPVDTECHLGQTDLNTATESELVLALNVPSDPTVRRIVALRPWLKGADLSSVPGIGPQRAASLASRVCATQPLLPPAVPLACIPGASALDLQAASAEEISEQLGLPRMTADDVLAARPLSQDLTQVIAPRVRGLSEPKLRRLLDAGRVCVTPAPMLAGGAAWRWATAEGGAVVRRDGYALVVPPGRVREQRGAYISVTPLPYLEDVLPHMDAEIHGAWSVMEHPVAVQGPWLGDGTDAAPVVLHEATDRGLTTSLGSGVAVSTVDSQPTVTALQYSLSPTGFGETTCGPTNNGFYSVPGSAFCVDSLVDGSAKDHWNARADRLASEAAARLLAAKPSCGTIGTAQALGAMPFGVSCSTESPAADGSATWRMTNDAYSSVLWGLAELKILYKYNVYNGTMSGEPTLSDGVETEPGSQLLIKAAKSRGMKLLFAGQTLSITKPLNSGETNVDMSVNVGATAAWAGITDILASAGTVLERWAGVNPARAEQVMLGCATFDASALGCLRNAVEEAATELSNSPAGLSASELRFVKTLKFGLRALNIGEWIVRFGTSFVYDEIGGDGVILRNYASSTSPSGGGTAPSSYIARDPSSGRSVLVENGRVLHIGDGGTFNCLAASRFVFDVGSLEVLGQRPDGAAQCMSRGEEWTFTPAAAGGNVPNNVILRERPEDAANGVIASWLINSRGEIQTIPDGGTYLCLAYANPVVWNVPFSAVQAWRPVGTAPASCG